MDSPASSPNTQHRILDRQIDREMKTSYLDYAMSVLIGRALPDARDGLKPVQRRILYAMFREGLFHDKKYSKCAGIVGEVLKSYHPHGDSAVYEALVRMAQDFNMRYTLVDGQGNFGSVDGDPAAAYRYTEARLSRIAEELLADIDSETVDLAQNFDARLMEPVVLPSKIPNLLVNGSSGIAVGMATNIPPHNIAEVTAAARAYIDNPDITTAELMAHIKGPDFPTGGIICGLEGVRKAYETGRGLITVRARMKTEQHKEKTRLIVTELPYQVNKAQLIEEIAELVQQKKLTGISDLRDESDRDGIRIVIELKKDAMPEIAENQLYSHTRLESTFGVIMIALVNNEPKTLTLKQIVGSFVSHRKQVVIRKTTFDLNKAEEKAHLLEGLIKALNSIDQTIRIIRESLDAPSAKAALISKLKVTEKQALAILDMRLQRLASLEQEKLRKEHSELLKLIAELKGILASERKILDIIKAELEKLRKDYGDQRRTEIGESIEDVEDEDLIPSQEAIVTVTHNGYIKRMSLDNYKQQRRGGKGIIAAEAGEQDFLESIFVANTHSHILFFTDKGMAHWLKVYKIPESSRHAMGKAMVNLLDIEGEKITEFIPVSRFDSRHYLMMATKKGIVKKTNLAEYSRPRRGGIIAINISEGDELIGVELTDGSRNVILATKNGLAARFDESNIRPTGRASQGVRGIRLRQDDEVIGMVQADETKTLLTITENGYGKRTPVNEYRLIGRGGSGVINIQTTERNGKAAVIKPVTDTDELMLISRTGIAIRITAKDIPVIGRNTQGVRIMKLQNDKLASAAIIAQETQPAQQPEQ
ncbi:DNA gyrase subunit A [Candidatus Woesearchaeota archaeon]|nr:DNA gyrase subunit A [Candidatus Woesearchaeota archaeon]